MQPTSAPPISNVKVYSLHIAEQINASNQKAIMRMDDGLTMYKVSTIIITINFCTIIQDPSRTEIKAVKLTEWAWATTNAGQWLIIDAGNAVAGPGEHSDHEFLISRGGAGEQQL